MYMLSPEWIANAPVGLMTSKFSGRVGNDIGTLIKCAQPDKARIIHVDRPYGIGRQSVGVVFVGQVAGDFSRVDVVMDQARVVAADPKVSAAIAGNREDAAPAGAHRLGGHHGLA